MTGQILRFANFLSPALFPTYERIVDAIARFTGIPASLETGGRLDDLVEGRLAGGFICGLVYVQLSRRSQAAVELSAAPLLSGERYQQRPCYFSDIVVCQDSPFTSFADLAGCTWAYNETTSHSGYNLIYYSLLQRNLSPTYFGIWRASGSHARSLDLVARGEADATAIDSHVLSALLRDDPRLAARVRLIGAFGPSAVPPVVVSKRLDAALRRTIQEALLTMAHNPVDAEHLRHGFIERFVRVEDGAYDDIRRMYDCVQGERQYV
ncbi:MAG TPA: PhnD/SsuA/transferrin family substrate-binding protein [Ktedonobacteraceae bacterium]|jgi:phosphonate transport system substrate-binding protein